MSRYFLGLVYSFWGDIDRIRRVCVAIIPLNRVRSIDSFFFKEVLRRSVCVNKRCSWSEENVVDLLAGCTAGTTGLIKSGA